MRGRLREGMGKTNDYSFTGLLSIRYCIAASVLVTNSVPLLSPVASHPASLGSLLGN